LEFLLAAKASAGSSGIIQFNSFIRSPGSEANAEFGDEVGNIQQLGASWHVTVDKKQTTESSLNAC
jgi:hypothetical protein